MIAVLPDAAQAATAIGEIDWRSGPIAEMVSTTLSVARNWFVFAFLGGLLLEYIGRAPGAGRDLAGYAWRTFIVLFLLVYYRDVFGSTINFAYRLTEDVAPKSVVGQLMKDRVASLAGAVGKFSSSAQPDTTGQSPPDSSGTTQQASTLTLGGLVWKFTGGMAFETGVSLLSAIGMVIHWVMSRLALILIAVFYILGPLALVFSLPSVSDTGTRWFSEFVGFLTWPIISGILLRVSVALSSHLMYGTDSGLLATLATAVITTASALACPLLASRLIAGSVKTAASHGIDTAKNLSRSAMDAGRKGAQLYKGLRAARALVGDPRAIATTAAGGASSSMPTSPAGE